MSYQGSLFLIQGWRRRNINLIKIKKVIKYVIFWILFQVLRMFGQLLVFSAFFWSGRYSLICKDVNFNCFGVRTKRYVVTKTQWSGQVGKTASCWKSIKTSFVKSFANFHICNKTLLNTLNFWYIYSALKNMNFQTKRVTCTHKFISSEVKRTSCKCPLDHIAYVQS